MSFMSSSPANRVPISEPYPCPECGAERIARVVENCRLDDGMIAKRLPHFKCRSCGARFFDDDAIHRIQSQRAARVMARAVSHVSPS